MSQSKRLFILEKAIELFSNSGFEAVSIQDITDSCGISKGAFYLSFKSKDELMVAIVEHLLTSVALIFDQAVSQSTEPQLRLHSMFEALLSFMRKNRGIAAFFMNEQIHFQHKNKDLLCILIKYEQHTRAITEQLLVSVYGEKVTPYIQDLILSLNSLVKTYFEYVCIRGLDVEIGRLAQSLVEKMNILALAEYKHALKNEQLLMLDSQFQFSEDDLNIFKERILHSLNERLAEEARVLPQQALHQIKIQLALSDPERPALYAYSSLLREYADYADLALQIRAFVNIKYPM